MLSISAITIFPELFEAIFGESIMKRAAQSGAVQFRIINLRNFTEDRHRTTDDRPYGGGPGMLMMPEPIFKAVKSIRTESSKVILLTPQGQPFQQKTAQRLSLENDLIFICPHYEGVDERVRTNLVDEEISIGDYILTNGILPAAVVIDATVRLIPGVLGHHEATENESFNNDLLEYPQYTRPADFNGMQVPDILLSGDHGAVARWRQEQAEERTGKRRPDLRDRPNRGKTAG